MLIYLIICVSLFCLNAEESHDTFLKGSADYKIDYLVQDDDIEMVRKDQLMPYKIIDKINKFSELNKLSKREYYRTIRLKSVVRKYYKGFDQPQVIKLVRRNAKSSTSSHMLWSTKETSRQFQKQDKLDEETEYIYDTILYEYYAEAKEAETSNETYFAVKIDPKSTGMMKFLRRFFTFNTKTEEQSNHRQSREVLANRIWKISQIWLIIYLIIAIPLWCTLGWCCCCLCCKCFKAHETIDESRRYLMWNPPGILREKCGDIVYEPSVKEKETYEELEHLIKTL